MNKDTIRVLVVDDTVTYRKIVSDVLTEAVGIEVVGTAANGKIALQKIEQLHPDILTLDLEMPVMDGLEVLRQLKDQDSPVGAIMLSAFTSDGADATVKALKLGAFDFAVKPSADTLQENVIILRQQLCPKIKTFAQTQNLRRIISDNHSSLASLQEIPACQPKPPGKSSNDNIATRMANISTHAGKPEVVVLGISTGGPQALTKMLPKLPADLPVPVLIVQHMPPMFTKSLADDLNKKCPLAVCEAHDNQSVKTGTIYIAPGGKQMKVHKNATGVVIQITDDPPENSCKPAVDYLFRSASHAYGPNVLGVIMTGMGNDGTLGCRLLKRHGAPILVQDEATCVVYGMPKQPAEEGIADVIAPLDRIAEKINQLARQGMTLCR